MMHGQTKIMFYFSLITQQNVLLRGGGIITTHNCIQTKQRAPDSQASQDIPEPWVSCGTCFI